MKTKITIEFSINSSPHLLYQYISSSSGLSEWFADNVNSRGDVFTFYWGDTQEKARLVSKKTDEKVKFRWLDEEGEETNYYFEIRIAKDEITKDVMLVVVDFAEENEEDDHKLLWENQINDLKKVLGSV